MKILFDTSHLIRILERSEPVSATDLGIQLRKGDHQLVLSLATVAELSAPLEHPAASTNVMRLLNALEHLPLVYVTDIRVDILELEAAINAWRYSHEPAPIDPFVDRLDRALPLDGSSPPAPPFDASLAEIVFALWQQNVLWGYKESLSRLRPAVQAHREVGLPGRTQHLIATVAHHLNIYGISFPRADIAEFGQWLAADWRRAPSTHLCNEIFRKLVANANDPLQAGDLVDLIHTGSLPYVDVLTLDRRMTHYASGAARSIGSTLGNRIHSTPESALKRLRGDA